MKKLNLKLGKGPFKRLSEKMSPYCDCLNKISVLLEMLGSILINFVIEAFSRHSVVAAWKYLVKTPEVFFYNAFMIFVTFTFVHLVRRRVFARIMVSALWLLIGISNGVMLMKRVTPFNAQDLKTFKEGLSLFTNYFSVPELIVMVIGVSAFIIWCVLMFKYGGKYKGKMNRLVSLACVIASCAAYSFVTNWAIDQRVVSTYFGNIAFAYQDYGLPYCFCASLFNTGISQPNGYTEESIDDLGKGKDLTEVSEDAEVLPNILFVQLESFFDTSEFTDLQTSEDPLPNLRKMFQEYSSG